MIKNLALLAALALASGCASRSHENQTAASGDSTYYYGIYSLQGYDNPSKGGGARAMMNNPYAENRLYTPAAGGALMIGGAEMETSSKGAGARSMMGETPE